MTSAIFFEFFNNIVCICSELRYRIYAHSRTSSFSLFPLPSHRGCGHVLWMFPNAYGWDRRRGRDGWGYFPRCFLHPSCLVRQHLLSCPSVWSGRKLVSSFEKERERDKDGYRVCSDARESCSNGRSGRFSDFCDKLRMMTTNQDDLKLITK